MPHNDRHLLAPQPVFSHAATQDGGSRLQHVKTHAAAEMTELQLGWNGLGEA